MALQSSLYFGTVIHRRTRPKKHFLRYKVFAFLIDLDELPDLDRSIVGFSYNSWSLMSFYNKDHGPLTDKPLRDWVESRMKEGGLVPDGGPIRLLCYPRILGYVFNPLSIFFCYSRKGELTAILYEVCNTFNERHTYIIPVKDFNQNIIHQACKKALYVSPFIGMDVEYHFRIKPPGKSISVTIYHEDAIGPLLTATFKGSKKRITRRSFYSALFSFPVLTLKVILGIHLEAFLLWLKGCPVFTHQPSPKSVQSSVGYNGKK